MTKAPQIRAGRGLLGWPQNLLADRAGVSANALGKIEAGGDARASTLDRIRKVLEQEGVEFLDGEAPGVRLRARP